MTIWSTLVIILLMFVLYAGISIVFGIATMLVFTVGQLVGMVLMAMLCAAGWSER